FCQFCMQLLVSNFIRNTSYAVCPKILNQSYLSFYLSSTIVLMYSILFVYSKRYFFVSVSKVKPLRALYTTFLLFFPKPYPPNLLEVSSFSLSDHVSLESHPFFCM